VIGCGGAFFDAAVCGDDVAQGRPAPYLIFRAMESASARNVHRVANVGDTALDLLAGHNAGVRWNVGVGVLPGAHKLRNCRTRRTLTCSLQWQNYRTSGKRHNEDI